MKEKVIKELSDEREGDERANDEKEGDERTNDEREGDERVSDERLDTENDVLGGIADFLG